MPERTAPANPDAALAAESHEAAPAQHYDTRPPKLSAWQRAQIPVIGASAAALVQLIGPTLRFDVLGAHNYAAVRSAGRRAILTFWHRSIFPAIWWWRNRGIVVLNSTNFDGQWTRRTIERFGFGTAQGSSTRGGLRGLVEMARQLDGGQDVAFTIDGPRGPRYVAKPGPVMLARRTGQPIVAFHIAVKSAHTFEKSWDLFQIPHPFSRAVIAIAPALEVPQHAGRDEVERKHAEMQAALERARRAAEAWFTQGPEERRRTQSEWDGTINAPAIR